MMNARDLEHAVQMLRLDVEVAKGEIKKLKEKDKAKEEKDAEDAEAKGQG